MAKNKKLQNVAVLAIFLFVAIMAIGEFGGLFMVTSYGGTTDYYLADATHPADIVDLTGSRNSAEIFSGCSNAKHIVQIEKVGTNGVLESRVKTFSMPLTKDSSGRFVFPDGSYTSSVYYRFHPAMAGDYIAREGIYCYGTLITRTESKMNFRVSARPATPTIAKYCSNLGFNQKTSSCYYKTCEVQANGNWDWSAIKQSSSFCDYVPPVTPPTAPPATPPACTPNWVTTEWSPCIDSLSTRMVTDNKNCANPSNAPPTTEKTCDMPVTQPPVNNGTGAGMTDAEKLQYCKDKGFTGYDAPTNTCTKTRTDTGNGGDDFVSKYKYWIALAVIGVFAWASGLMYYLGKKR